MLAKSALTLDAVQRLHAYNEHRVQPLKASN